jgi:predicted ATPase
MKYVPPFYVITGGPGSGKTTVLEELVRRGHVCIPEDARALIQEQVASNGSALPWSDAPRFAELLMQRSIITYRAQAAARHAESAKNPQTPVYFDRGVGDAFTYADIIGHTPSAGLNMEASACCYRNPIFLAPWWPAIYATDTERRQTIEEAERTEHALSKTYTDLGYRILKLPLTSPQERADFILCHSAEL